MVRLVGDGSGLRKRTLAAQWSRIESLYLLYSTGMMVGMGFHVFPQAVVEHERFLAHGTLKRSLTAMSLEMPTQVVRLRESFQAHVTSIGLLVGMCFLMTT